MSDTPISEMTFEQAMSELERIVTQLERGDVPLEDSISLYEKGAELKKRCETKLILGSFFSDFYRFFGVTPRRKEVRRASLRRLGARELSERKEEK